MKFGNETGVLRAHRYWTRLQHGKPAEASQIVFHLVNTIALPHVGLLSGLLAESDFRLKRLDEINVRMKLTL